MIDEGEELRGTKRKRTRRWEIVSVLVSYLHMNTARQAFGAMIKGRLDNNPTKIDPNPIVNATTVVHSFRV